MTIITKEPIEIKNLLCSNCKKDYAKWDVDTEGGYLFLCDPCVKTLEEREHGKSD